MSQKPETARRHAARGYAVALRQCAKWADCYAARCERCGLEAAPSVLPETMRRLADQLDDEAQGQTRIPGLEVTA
jgi:hypothetical protein